MRMIMTGFAIAALALPVSLVGAHGPETLAVAGEDLAITLHAQGSQVYECMTDISGKLAWQFREPIATLLVGDRTVGRHYSGPTWELADGSAVMAKVTGRAPAETVRDIPLLRLEVTTQRGAGELSGISTIQRLNTRGGVAQGPCERAGAFLSVPYSADYAFFKRKD
jgi:hypothetical protein